MNQEKPKQIHTKTDKISSNDGNNKMLTTMLEVRGKKLLSPKASARKRPQRHAPEAQSF